MNEIEKQLQRILNGHSENVREIEQLLAEPLNKLVQETQGKKDEELAGIMNFYWMEIVQIVRKSAAIGYLEALPDKELKEVKP